jgi:uncharacterized membrane protein YeaQ/YmgE (transglycosylase-associated protein family)
MYIPFFRSDHVDPILRYIIVGLVAGWAAGSVMKGSSHRPLFDMLLGVLGAMAGGYIVRALGLAVQGGLLYPIIVAAIGACVVVTFARLASDFRRAADSAP